MKKTILAFLMFLTLLSISCKGPVDPVPINRTTFTDRAGRYLPDGGGASLILNDVLEKASFFKNGEMLTGSSDYERADSARTGASLVLTGDLTITFTGENTAMIASTDVDINGLTLTRTVNRLTFANREGTYKTEDDSHVLALAGGAATYTVRNGPTETVRYDRGELAQEFKLVLEFSSFDIIFQNGNSALSYDKDGMEQAILNRPQP